MRKLLTALTYFAFCLLAIPLLFGAFVLASIGIIYVAIELFSLFSIIVV